MLQIAFKLLLGWWRCMPHSAPPALPPPPPARAQIGGFLYGGFTVAGEARSSGFDYTIYNNTHPLLGAGAGNEYPDPGSGGPFKATLSRARLLRSLPHLSPSSPRAMPRARPNNKTTAAPSCGR